MRLCGLADNIHKVGLCNLEWVQPVVTFLGHVITAEGKAPTPKCIAAIENIPQPITKKQVLAFLDMNTVDPSSCKMEAPLSSIVHGKGLAAHQSVTWKEEPKKVFVDLKIVLPSTLCDYTT